MIDGLGAPLLAPAQDNHQGEGQTYMHAEFRALERQPVASSHSTTCLIHPCESP